MKVLEIREIEIDKIAVPDWARRTVMSDAELDDLKNSIRKRGQIAPVVVRPRDDGSYELVSGSRRLEVLKRLGRTEVEAKVIECTDEEAIALSIEENLKRAEEHVFDTARKVSMLYEKMGNSRRKVARFLGRDETWVSMMKKIHGIDEKAKEILAPEVKDYRKIYLVAEVDDPEKQRILANYVARHNPRREEIEELVKVARSTTVEGFRNYCESRFRREGEVHGEGSGGAEGVDMSTLPQAQTPATTQGAQTAASSTGTDETRECDLCLNKKPRRELRFYAICRNEHPGVHELMRELRRHASVDSSHAIDAAIALFRYVIVFPPEMQQEVARKALRVIEKIGPLDVERLEELVKEVKGRDDQDQD